MGIRGLGAYLDQNGGFIRFEDISQAAAAEKLNASLVIDGLSLSHFLRHKLRVSIPAETFLSLPPASS